MKVLLVDKSNSQLEEDNSKYYTIDENGVYHLTDEAVKISRIYTLCAEDEYGNQITPIKFRMINL